MDVSIMCPYIKWPICLNGMNSLLLKFSLRLQRFQLLSMPSDYGNDVILPHKCGFRSAGIFHLIIPCSCFSGVESNVTQQLHTKLERLCSLCLVLCVE